MKSKFLLSFFLLKLFIGVFILQAEEPKKIKSNHTSILSSTSPLTPIFHDSSSEEGTKVDGARQAPALSHQPSQLPRHESDEISELMMWSSFKEPKTERNSEQSEFFFEKYGRSKYVSEDKENDSERERLLKDVEDSDNEEQETALPLPEDLSLQQADQGNRTIKKINPISIIHRGYINLNIPEFETIAGASRGPQSRAYNSLAKKLKQYQQKGKNQSKEEALSFLKELAEETEKYILIKENSLFKERKKVIPSTPRVERACQRIDASHLLLNGIMVERLRLDNPEGSINYSPFHGHYIAENQIMNYQSDFAAGMISQVARFKLNTKFSREFIFKPVQRKEIPELNARQLGFSKELIATGITEEEANFLGRALATYRIAQLIRCDLVPEVMPIIFSLGGNQEAGNAQKYLDGEEIYQEKTINLSKDDLALLFGSLKLGEEYLAEVATGISQIQEGWKLCFSDLEEFQEVSPEKPFLERGEKISFERALNLAEEGKIFFQKKELCSVKHDINFSDPKLQRSLSNIQLLHLITGEQDPNPKNFLFKKDDQDHWSAYSIDHDLSFPRNFANIDDQSIEERRFTKGARYILKVPLLIDEEMGESILSITSEDIENALRGTRLTKAEIEATISRLTYLQEYISKEKESGGYVKVSKTDLSDEGSLVWGNETYKILKELPDRSYIAKLLEAINYKEKELQAILNQKNQILKRRPLLEKDSGERRKITKSKRHNFLKPPFAPFEFSQVSEGDYSEEEDNEESDLKSEVTAETIRSVNFSKFISVIHDLRTKTYEDLKKKVANLMQPSFFSVSSWKLAIPVSEEMQKLIFDNNTLRLTAEKMEEDAQNFFNQVIGKEFPPVLHQNPWREVVKRFDDAQATWNKAIKALEQEKDSLPDKLHSLRQSDFEIAKNKQQMIAVDLLWAQLYEAEHRAKLDEQETLQSQQAWRILASHLTPSFQDPSKKWEKQFQVAESLSTECTELFPYWLKALKIRHNSLAASSTLASLSIKNADEIRVWDDLLNHVYGMEDIVKPDSNTQMDRIRQILWNNVIQEIGFQKLYALAQKATIDVSLLQKEITRLAQDNIVQTRTHIAKIRRFGYPMTYVELMSIVGADREKLNDLYCFWEQFKKGIQIERQSWSAVFEAQKQLISNKKLKNEKALQGHSEQSDIAWLFFQAQHAKLLGDRAIQNFSKLNLSRASSPFESDVHDPQILFLAARPHRFQTAINNFPLDDVSFSLKQAQELCNEVIARMGASNDYPICWKPPFPSQQLYRFEEQLESIAGVDREEDYLFLNFYQEEVMKSFLNQIQDFPGSVEFQIPLEEMVNGTSNKLKEEWEQTAQEMEVLRTKLQGALDQLALLRGFADSI